MQDKIKRWREDLDTISGMLEYQEQVLENGPHYEWDESFSKAVSYKIGEAAKSVVLARMWMGEFLAYFSNSPYAQNDGSRESVKDIVPTADVGEEKEFMPESEDIMVSFMDDIREDLRDANRAFHTELTNLEGYPMLPTANIYQHLTEGRMWLGQALGAIRKYHEHVEN